MIKYRRHLSFLFIILFILTFSTMWKKEPFSNQKIRHQQSFLSRLEGPLMGDDPSLVSYLRRKFLIPPSKLSYNITKFNKLIYNKPLLGNVHYHSFILKTFNNTDGPGFFVEAGALDGEVGSNTLWLEYNKNWTGLLIEPNRESCNVLRLKNRKAWSSCSCISPKKYAEKSLFEIPTAHNFNYALQ